MCKMIINADDFGYCRAVNYGIADAHLEGLLTSATLLTNSPGFEHAVELSRQLKNLGVGLHLNIAMGRPLTAGATLIGKNGEFIKPRNLPPEHVYDPEEVSLELEAQYVRFVDAMGKKPTHLDSHLFTTDSNPVMAEVARNLAEKYRLPLRNHRITGFPLVKFIQFRTYDAEAGLDYIKDNIEHIVSHPYVEIMSHPAYMDSYLMNTSTYHVQRLAELEVLVSTQTKELMKAYGVELIHYGQI